MIINKYSKYIGVISILIASLVILTQQSSAQSASFIDIGLKVNQGTASSPDIQVAAVENPSVSASSPLKIAKNGTIYNVALVDPNDPFALKVLVTLPGNVIKALRKLGKAFASFNDQSMDALGHFDGNNTTRFYGELVLNNNSAYRVDFERISTDFIDKETALRSFFIGPNSIKTIKYFGNLSVSGDNPPLPAQYYGTKAGSATYSIKVNGVEIDTVTYSWTYMH